MAFWQGVFTKRTQFFSRKGKKYQKNKRLYSEPIVS
jgi:hypothetical protein